jgi:hypothetical protein
MSDKSKDELSNHISRIVAMDVYGFSIIAYENTEYEKYLKSIHKKIKERHKAYYGELRERQLMKMNNKPIAYDILVKVHTKCGYIDEILYNNENSSQYRNIVTDYEISLDNLKKLFISPCAYTKTEMKKLAEILLFKLIKYKSPKEMSALNILRHIIQGFKDYSEELTDKIEVCHLQGFKVESRCLL